MATVISKTTIQAAIGTTTPIRVTVLDKSTRVGKDLSTYTAKIALKVAAGESSTYLIDPVAATTDSSGNIDGTFTAAAMEAAAVVAQAGQTVVGEVVAYLGGVEQIRAQFPVQLKARVIL